MRIRIKPVILIVLALFLVPLALYAAFYATEKRPHRWDQADWSSAGVLPRAMQEPAARVLVFTARTGGWKGVFSLHSWIVIKPENAPGWTRYDVVGWGSPVRTNGWAPDGRWFGDNPKMLVDVRGVQASVLIPKIQAAVRDYAFGNAGDYHIWPGPNSNTFVATVLRAVPELGVTLPPNAVGKDFRDGAIAGLTPSGTGIEATLYGLLGITVGWVEGIEFNLFGLVAGLDLRYPALKLPGFGRVGFDAPALAGPRS
jgi:hypothetical protein